MRVVYLTQVKATDRDVGVNAEISYRLSPQSDLDHVFSIDAGTGHIYIRSALDYERSARYHLTVMASDGGARNQLMEDDDGQNTQQGTTSTNVTASNEVNWLIMDRQFDWLENLY